MARSIFKGTQRKFILSWIFLLTSYLASAQNELDVIEDNWLYYKNAPNSLYQHLSAEAYDLLEQRTQTVSRHTITGRLEEKTGVDKENDSWK